MAVAAESVSALSVAVPESSTRARFIALWLLIGAIAAVVCSFVWPSAHIEGNAAVGIEAEYLPVGIDSFYHARRILDTVENPSAFSHAEPKIHVPEGSLLPWPWGYDYAMAWTVKAAQAVGIPGPPILILIWIPVVAVFASVGLTMLLARQLSLSLWSASLAGLCVALSPLTQILHGVGMIDHHYGEYILVLATVTFGLRWFAAPEQVSRAIVLGFILGAAPAIHNGLFILQLPVLATAVVLWVQGIRLPRRAAIAFAVSLVGTTLAILLPSLPFRLGKFEFYLLSWFHLYAAAGTGIAMILMSRFENTRRGTAILAGGALVLLLPVIAQIALAGAFLTGHIARLDAIQEMFSPMRIVRTAGPWAVSGLYSALLWLLPLT